MMALRMAVLSYVMNELVRILVFVLSIKKMRGLPLPETGESAWQGAIS